MKRFKGKKGIIILILLACLIVGYYFYLSNISNVKKVDAQVTPVQSVLLRDLSKNYPPSPKEVIKYYAEITKCFIEGGYSEDEFVALANKAKELYDSELIANKTDEEYMTDLRTELESYRQKEYKISSYSTSSSLDVEYFSEDGYEFARLYCVYTIREASKIFSTNHVYLLRKDDAGHYKIYGWDLADNLKDE